MINGTKSKDLQDEAGEDFGELDRFMQLALSWQMIPSSSQGYIRYGSLKLKSPTPRCKVQRAIGVSPKTV